MLRLFHFCNAQQTWSEAHGPHPLQTERISKCGKRMRSLLSPIWPVRYSAWFCVVKATIAGATAPHRIHVVVPSKRNLSSITKSSNLCFTCGSLGARGPVDLWSPAWVAVLWTKASKSGGSRTVSRPADAAKSMGFLGRARSEIRSEIGSSHIKELL